jgi:voltage-gated potassium channel Kch
MSSRPTTKQRVQYWFDNLMSKGSPAMILMLFLLSVAVIIVAAAVLTLFRIAQPDGGPLTFGEAAWESMMRTLDPGTMGGDTGSGFRFVMLLVTLGGVFVVSSLIGVISSGVDTKLTELRKGRSVVLEENHTVILGWSPQIFTILSEIITANENQKRPAIAILADKDKVVMEDEIRERVPDTKNTRIICRSGTAIDPADLEIVNPHLARSIIILPEGDMPDAFVLKTALAIVNSRNRHPEPYCIVAQVRSRRAVDLTALISAHDRLTTVLSGELIARVTAQTSRQSGLSVVYTELLNFGGDEIYFKEEPTLSGRTYGDALSGYEDSTVLGIFDGQRNARLNPPPDTRFQPGDKVIAISADDDTIRLSGLTPAVDAEAIRAAGPRTETNPESCLLLGWNDRAAILVRELDAYVAPGSSLTIVAADGELQSAEAAAVSLHNQKCTFMTGDTTDRAVLDALNIQDFDHVIVLSDSTLDVQRADARTLIILLHLRDISEHDATPFSIVSEMLDMRNRALAEVARVDDFIVSDHFISLMLAQISENVDLYPVFTDLFDPEGSEIYLKCASDYVETGRPVSFYTVIEAARRRNETAFGYRIAAQSHDADLNYGIRTNPKKSEMVTFTPVDKVIVLAED